MSLPLDVSAYLVLYVAFGFLWVKLEHDTIEWDFENMKTGEIILGILQQTVHYTRVCAVWPTYVVEDFIVWAMNQYYGGDDDDEAADL